jgi:hypothetical protein
VALSVIGFYVSNATSYPWIQNLLAPSYVKAKAAIEEVKKAGSIQRGQAHFEALAGVVEDRIAQQNPTVSRSAIVLERLEATGGGIAMGPAVSRQTVGLKMTFRGQQQPLQWDLLELGDVVEEGWKGRSLTWATILFWAGVVQTVWPLFLEAKGK